MTSRRLLCFDWLRGLAVLLMVHAHSGLLLRPDVQAQKLWRWCNFAHGLVFPTFLFVAGFFFALRSHREPLRVALKRLGRLSLVALVLSGLWFRFALDLRWVWRLDVLACIALSLLVTLPLVYGLAARPLWRAGALLLLALTAFGLAPWASQVEGTWAFLLSTRSGSLFPLLPWAGHAAIGACVGAAVVAWGGLRPDTSRPLELALMVVALVGSLVWVWGPSLANLYPPHAYWRVSPGPHAERWTVVAWLTTALYAWDRRVSVPRLFERALAWLGAQSLWLYGIHLTLLTAPLPGGSLANRWRESLTFGQGLSVAAGLLALSAGLTWLVPLGVARVRTSRFGVPGFRHLS